ncbi:MAG: FIST signal transduction protein, partial [Bacteroidota bacterium]
MNYKTAYSVSRSVATATDELKAQLSEIKPAMVLFFASPVYPPEEISEKMAQAFPDSKVFGCSSSGEIVSGKMLDQSIVAMAFSSEVIEDVTIEVINDLQQPESSIATAVSNISTHYGMPLQEMDYKTYAGILLIDGLSGSEETVIDLVGNYTNIAVVGGSAGDDLAFKQTHVYANGKAYNNAALLAVLKPKNEFGIIKTQSFNPGAKNLTVTKTNEARREVLEFNDKPAAVAYAEALNTSKEELPAKMFRSPLGLMIDETEPFVRSPRVVENDSVFFYCAVKEGMELNVLESTDIVKDTKEAIAGKKEELGDISAILNFHC